MLQIFSTLNQVFRKSLLILGILSLSIVSSLFISLEQPSLASPISEGGQKLIQQEKMDKESQAVEEERSEAYEEEVEAAKDPDKVYEKNLKTYEKSHPQENVIEKTAEGAQKLIEKVTGKE